MKPERAAEIRGPFKPIPTASPAIGLSEILPKHARLADKFSLVRSCYHTAAAVHDTGHQMMQTGRLFTGGINTPHAGCVLSYLRGRRSDLAGARAAAQADGSHRRQHAARAGRRLSGQGVRSVRAQRRSVAAELPGARSVAAQADRRSAPGAAGEDCATSSNKRSTVSRRAKTSNCSGQQLRRGLPHHDQHAGALGLRAVARAGRGSRSLWPQSIRPVLPDGPPADRGGRAVRHGQHVPDRLRRDHLGHSRHEAVHFDRRHARHRGADVRPGLQRPDRGSRTSAACSTTRWSATWPSSAARRG